MNYYYLHLMQTLILLHGALGSAAQLRPLAESLNGHFAVHSINFSGHGGTGIPQQPFSIPFFAEEVLAYIDAHKLSNVTIFGYSMGGYVAMFLAKMHPEKINRVITLATKFHWDDTTAAKEVLMLDPEIITEKVPAFATALSNRHAPEDWKEIMNKTAAMLLELGRNNTLKPGDYAGINTPCLILLGDRDTMITLDETVQTYRSLPNAQMAMLPASGHPIEKINLEILTALILSK